MKAQNLGVFMVLAVSVVTVALFSWPQNKSNSAPEIAGISTDTPREYGREALLPLAARSSGLSPEKVALGARLFFEKRLSRDNSIACASCHDFARGGTDRMPVSTGVDGKTGPINAPTVFNAALNFVQFWDGRAGSLEEQAAGPVHNPLEMASNWGEVVAKLAADDGYREAFRRIYAKDPDGASIVDAIATYERTLMAGNSRFDRYLLGEKNALTPAEVDGYQRFLDYGCASCHQGVGVGGNMYQRFGIMGDYFQGRKPSAADLGRYNVTGRDEDRYVFKVPSLRNVAVTAPYFHDASAPTLEAAVYTMGLYQLGRRLTKEEVASLVAFLRTLTGEWQGQTLQ